MDRTPPPVSLAAALALPRTPGRSAEVFVDGDLEVRFAARPTNGPQVPHQRDEFYPRFFPSADRKSGPDRGKVTRDNRRRILLTSCPSFSWRSPQPCRRPGVLGRERRIPALFGGIAALQGVVPPERQLGALYDPAREARRAHVRGHRFHDGGMRRHSDKRLQRPPHPPKRQ